MSEVELGTIFYANGEKLIFKSASLFWGLIGANVAPHIQVGKTKTIITLPKDAIIGNKVNLSTIDISEIGKKISILKKIVSTKEHMSNGLGE